MRTLTPVYVNKSKHHVQEISHYYCPAAGHMIAHSYILKQVTPGSHTITSKSENDATLTLRTVGSNSEAYSDDRVVKVIAMTYIKTNPA